MSTSEGCRCPCHTEAENVSGTVLWITRGNERSLRISLPFPLITTSTPAGCALMLRPGGTATARRIAKLCVSGCCAATATYSMMAKKMAASLMGQLRTNSCPKLPAIGSLLDQPPDEGFAHRPVPLRRPDDLLHNHTVAVDHPTLGHARRLVGPLNRP